MKLLLPLIPVLLLASCKSMNQTSTEDPTDPYASAYPGYDPNASSIEPPASPSDYAYNGAGTTPVPADPYATNPYTPAQPTYPNPPVQPPYTTPTYTPPPSGKTYTIKKGDTLYSIARTFDTNVGALTSANNLSSDLIRIGQTITIP